MSTVAQLPIHVIAERGPVEVFTRGGGRCLLAGRAVQYKVPFDGGLLVFPDGLEGPSIHISARAILEALGEVLAAQRAHPPAPVSSRIEEPRHA